MFLRSLTEHSHSNWQHTQFVWWGEDEGGLFPGHSQFLSHMAGSQWVVPRDHRNLQHRPRYSVSGLSPGIIATCSMNTDLVIQSVGCHLWSLPPATWTQTSLLSQWVVPQWSSQRATQTSLVRMRATSHVHFFSHFFLGHHCYPQWRHCLDNLLQALSWQLTGRKLSLIHIWRCRRGP